MTNSEKINIPGFVDIQVNGYAGVDFSHPNLTMDDLESVCDALYLRGTAAFLPTVITSPIEIYKRNLPLIARAMRTGALKGRLLGIHLEGPFISRELGFRGVHDPRYMLESDTSLLRRLQELAEGKIRLITLAAELPGAPELAHCARELGMAVSIGHSSYNAADLAKASSAGASALTHLGNGIPNEIPRHENPLWAALADDDFTAMIITDGHHLPDSLVKVIIRTKGAQKIVVVSDLCPIAGQPPGEYLLYGNRVVLNESGRIFKPNTCCLAGSGCTMFDSMNRLASLRILSLKDLLRVGYENPLDLIGIPSNQIQARIKLIYDHQAGMFSIDS